MPDTPSRITPAERAKRAREAKLDEVREDVESGRLTIRKLSKDDLAALERAQKRRLGGPERARFKRERG